MKDAAIDPATFAHRPNSNGTIDSICMTCFMTIATKPTENELVHDENRHDCKEVAMEKVVIASWESSERFY